MKTTVHIFLFCFFYILHVHATGNKQSTIDALVQDIKASTVDSVIYEGFTEIGNILLTLEEDTARRAWSALKETFTGKDHYNGLGRCAYVIARELRGRGEYFTSYEYYLESLSYYKKAKYQRGMAIAHNGLGSLLKDIRKFDESEFHYLESARLYRLLNDTIWEASIYLNLGGMFEENDSLELAKHYLKKSEDILKPIEHEWLLHLYTNMGIVYFKDRNYELAYYYLSQGYDLSNHEGGIRERFNSAYFLGKYLFEQERVFESRTYLEEGRRIIKDSTYVKLIPIKFLVDFTLTLSKYYERIEDIDKAYYYLKESRAYEARNKIKQANLEMYRIEIDLAIQESKRKQKRHENLIIISLSALIITLLFLFVLYKGYKQKQKANLLLTEMDALKTRLYSNISHELRTPLTLIIGRLEQILSSDAKKRPTESQIRLMRRNANSLLVLINQMLDLSKIDAKGLKLELIEDDIVAFIKVHFVSFASLADRKKIKFNTYFLSEKKVVLFDAGKLEKIINNLVSNAIKFTSIGGEVFCNASFSKPNELQITVQDTGKGIPQDQLEKIFNRFHQVTGTYSSNPGTGIGLSLTKELVELMHGTITVESVVEKGTRFTVHVPLGTEHLQSKEYEIVETDSYIPQARPNEDDISTGTELVPPDKKNKDYPLVLVVEDHEEISSFIRENLQENYQVDTAENGVLGIEKALENIPDLVISDVMMPEMDGIEMTEKLKLDERTSHIPVILLTARISEQDKMKGLETGADAFLAKPFSIKELNLRVQKLIEQRGKLRERFTANLKLEPKDIAVTSADEKFLDRAMEIIEENISNADFEVRNFQDQMLMSRMQLFRKIKALTNQTPGEFIRTIRLKRAAYLMDQQFGNIAQITFEVGFNNPSYFAKCFKELYGKLPSEYIKEVQKGYSGVS